MHWGEEGGKEKCLDETAVAAAAWFCLLSAGSRRQQSGPAAAFKSRRRRKGKSRVTIHVQKTTNKCNCLFWPPCCLNLGRFIVCFC